MMKSSVDRTLQGLFQNLNSPLLIVISGPSGVGKDTVLNRMKQRNHPCEFVITATTRKQRPSEKDHVDYHFLKEDEFQGILKRDGFLECAKVYDNWYGVPKDTVKEALASGRDAIIKVDVQGAATIKSIVPEALFIFLAPPSADELVSRLTGRSTESPPALALRLETAAAEMEQIRHFDFVVVNRYSELERTVDQIYTIMAAEKCRVKPRRISF